jgi:hypothetical protein
MYWEQLSSFLRPTSWWEESLSSPPRWSLSLSTSCILDCFWACYKLETMKLSTHEISLD